MEILYLMGKSLLSYSMDDWNKIRGTELSMIFQDCGAMINPIRKIGNQFIEYIRTHEKMSKEEASKKAINMLGQMMLSNPDNIMKKLSISIKWRYASKSRNCHGNDI